MKSGKEGNALPPGFRLGSYELQHRLGSGGFAITYLAWHRSERRLVAVKELLPTGIAVRRPDGSVVMRAASTAEDWERCRQSFRAEAESLRSIRHPNIVRLRDLREENGTLYLVMDYVEGRSLETILKNRGRLSYRRVQLLAEGILAGLGTVHALGLLHRDIKPSNIIVQPHWHPVLIDFGSARLESQSTVTASAIVSHSYSPFELYQSRARQGPYTDLYSLGAVLFHAVTGTAPPAAPDRMMEDRCPALAGTWEREGYPAEVLETIDRALTIHPEGRPQDISEWRRMTGLPPSEEQLAADSVQSPSWAPEELSAKRTRTVLWMLPVLFAGLLVALLAFLRGGNWYQWSWLTPDLQDRAQAAFLRGDYRFVDRLLTTGDKTAESRALPLAARSEFEYFLGENSFRGQKLIDVAERLAADRTDDGGLALLAGAVRTYGANSRIQERRALKELERAQRLPLTGADPALLLLFQGACHAGLGEMAIAAREWDKAEQGLKEELQRDPHNPRLRRWLGEVYCWQDRKKDALREFRAAVGPSRSPAVLHLLLSRTLSDHRQSLGELERALRDDPNYTLAIREMGAHDQALAEYEAAERNYRLRIAAEAMDATARLELATVLGALGRDSEARLCLDEAARIDPQHFGIQLQLGHLFHRLGEEKEAVQCYSRVVEEGGASAAMLALVSRANSFRSLHQDQEAFRDLDEAVRRFPGEAEPYYWRALARKEKGYLAEALQDFGRALDLGVSDYRVYRDRGTLCFEQERYREARRDFLQAGQLAPKKEATNLLLQASRCLYRLQEYQAAADELTRLIQARQISADVFNLQAILFEKLGDQARSLERYRQAVSMNDARPGHHTNYGWALIRAGGRSQEAIAEFSRAIREQPAPSAYRGRAAAYQQRGNPGDAERAAEDERLAERLPGKK